MHGDNLMREVICSGDCRLAATDGYGFVTADAAAEAGNERLFVSDAARQGRSARNSDEAEPA
jgi:hypothetical protein